MEKEKKDKNKEEKGSDDSQTLYLKLLYDSSLTIIINQEERIAESANQTIEKIGQLYIKDHLN